MKVNTIYILKFWSALRKLFKCAGEDFLLISKMLMLVLPWAMVSTVQDLHASTKVEAQTKYILKGTVLSAEDNKPLEGVSIHIENENLQITTSKNGTFELTVRNQRGKIKFSYIGYKSQEINYTSGVSLLVKLIPEDYKLEEVEVVSTGYQKIPKERATGSFEFVDNNSSIVRSRQTL